MEPVFNVVLPVFAIILAGYLSGRAGVLGDQSTDALNSFVYWVALPVLLFHAMASVDSSKIFDWRYIGAYIGSVSVVFIFGFVVAKVLFRASASEGSLFAMTAIFSNTGYMGIPLSIVAFGDSGALPAVIATVSQTILYLAIPVCVIEMTSGAGRGLAKALKGTMAALLKNPMIVAPVLGILYSLTGLPVPKPIGAFSTVLGAAAAPCALFAMGLFLVGKPIRKGKAEISAMVFIKLLIHPLAAWWLATHVFEVRDDWVRILLLMAALPTGATVFVLAQRYDLYVQRTSTATLFSTVLAVVTVSILFGLDF